MNAAHLTQRTRKEFNLTREQWAILVTLPGYRGASVHETLGPHWQDIYWTPGNTPRVVTKLTRAEVALALGPLAKRPK